MVKFSLVAGAALTLAGVAAGCWPDDNALARGRRLVPTRTYERRGPTVMVHAGAERARVSAGGAVSVTGVLGADGVPVEFIPLKCQMVVHSLDAQFRKAGFDHPDQYKIK